MQFKSFMESLTTEEKTIEVTMKSGHKFTAPIKVTHKDWHIVKHPVSGKQYRVDHKGNTLEEEVDLSEEHIVHVDDGSKYGDQPHKKDADHVMVGVKKHNGKFDGHSDKGAYFKFNSKSDAEGFVRHVKAAPHKTVYADLHEELDESVADSWKKVQSMDKGSVTGGKDEVKKRLAYLNAVHDHHKKFGNDTKKVKSEIEKINRSHIAEESLDEADIQARADYKLDKRGRKYHKQIHFKDGSNDEANEKNEVREETEMNEEMTDAQKAERERIVKGMKKNIAGFKAKYGERAKEVMYATATKQAMKEETLEEGTQSHKVNVTVSDPNHTMVTMRKEKIAKRVVVSATDKGDALAKAKSFYQKKGYKVHDVEHHSVVPKTTMKTEEATLDEEQLDERNKENATRRKMMDASRGARWKVQNKVSADDVRDWDGKHKTAQAQNKAIGRALRNEEAEDLEEVELDEAIASAGKHPLKRVWVHGTGINTHAVYGETHSGETVKVSGGHGYDSAKEKAKKVADKHGLSSTSKHGVSFGKTTNEEVELDEAVESGNKGYGYHGAHPSETADKEYSKAHATVKKVAAQAGHLRDAKKPNVMVKHYLDSRHGRHLADVGTHDHEYIKKDFGKFKKSYKESDFAKESVGFDEEGNLMSEKLTYAQFMEQLLEYTPGPGGVTRVQGRSYGAQYHDPEGDDDADDKPKKKAEPAVKRGRGRPAGSKSGANQKVTSGKSYGGIATHSLHLPSSNR